jgi:protein-tyrosine phosphatase
MINEVLVVCEGNICRSPFASALLSKLLPALRVSSAGTHALVGEAADSLAAQMAMERGIDLSHHAATMIDGGRVRAADLILTMTAAQCASVQAAWPFACGKVFRLSTNDGIDVVDPYGRRRNIFELAFAQIEHGVAHWHAALAGLTH